MPIQKIYLDLLEGVYKTVPDEGRVPEDGMIVQKPSLLHYAPKDKIVDIKKHGLLTKRTLVAKFPETKKILLDRYRDLVAEKLNIRLESVNENNIMEFLDMTHPGLTKTISAFFSRIPEGIEQYQKYLQTHVPVKIALKKLDDSRGGYKIFGAGFPTRKNWVPLSKDNVENLCEKKRDWYNYFAASDPENLFHKVPHAMIFSRSGSIPPFALKPLDDDENKDPEETEEQK